MAHEVTPFKKAGCSISLCVELLTDREKHSREINELFGEGGALNANYQTVEAVAIVASALGAAGLRYGLGGDYVFKTGSDRIEFDFKDDATQTRAYRVLKNLNAFG